MSPREAYEIEFASYEQADEFMRLLEYADKGRVIVDWGSIEQDEPEYDPEGDNIFPIFDESDRSDHAWYPLAEKLSWCGVYDTLYVDPHEKDGEPQPLRARFYVMGFQDEIVLPAAKQCQLMLRVAA